MNQTNFEHAGFALMMQSVFLLLGVFVFHEVTMLAWIGAAFPVVASVAVALVVQFLL